MNENIRTDILSHYKLTITDVIPMKGGWLNRMHILNTKQGAFLLKEYSRKRYPQDSQLKDIEAALSRQEALRLAGVPTVRILRPYRKALRMLSDGTAYSVMEYCTGQNLTPDTIALTQMHALGETCARMHSAFAALPCEGIKEQHASAEALTGALQAHYERFKDQGSLECRAAVNAIPALLNALPETFFSCLHAGIAHEDFTPDNLLFDENKVLAVIDFDRNCLSFPLHDIGRALLSFALQDDVLRPDFVSAFAEGYRQHLPLSQQDIRASLLLTLCIEAPWWFRPLFFETDQGKATRFLQEILWVLNTLV